jgi:hypothetical protein
VCVGCVDGGVERGGEKEEEEEEEEEEEVGFLRSLDFGKGQVVTTREPCTELYSCFLPVQEC